MLVLSRISKQLRPNVSQLIIKVGDKTTVLTVEESRGSRVKLSFDGDPDFIITRREVYEPDSDTERGTAEKV